MLYDGIAQRLLKAIRRDQFKKCVPVEGCKQSAVEMNPVNPADMIYLSYKQPADLLRRHIRIPVNSLQPFRGQVLKISVLHG